jgi:hypothetical protein
MKVAFARSALSVVGAALAGKPLPTRKGFRERPRAPARAIRKGKTR